MRTSAARLKGKELHLTFRECLLSILNGASNAASRFGADEIGIVTDFYTNLSIIRALPGTHTVQALRLISD